MRNKCINVLKCEILFNSKLIFIAFSNSCNEDVAGQLSAVKVRFLLK